MAPAWLLLARAADAGTPALEGRDLHAVADPVFEGNGPGAGIFVDARGLGSDDATLGGTLAVGWTIRPLRLAVAVPGEASTNHVDGLPPRLDALFVLSDRRKGGLGVAGGLDVPLPFFPGPDRRRASGKLSLGVGKAHTALVVNLGAPIGIPLERLDWSVGAAAPLVDVLSGFLELEGAAPVVPDEAGAFVPSLATARLGLHLAPVPPLVLGFAVEGHPDDLHPTLSGSVVWIPPPRAARRPSTASDTKTEPSSDHAHDE